VIKLLLLLFLYGSLFANIDDLQNANSPADTEEIVKDSDLEEVNIAPSAKVIYLSYEALPERVLKGEIFKVTIKSLCVVKEFTDITYELINGQGVKLLSNIPSRNKDSKHYYETFYFVATSEDAKLPDFKATLLDYNSTPYKDTILSGEKLNVISLNPKNDFANIIANSFEILEHKTTNYNATHNIIVFVAAATNSDITSLKLGDVQKQGIESFTGSYIDSRITYYAIIDKKVENLLMSYFNLVKNRFIPINIPIVVSDDSVTTQSDLKPTDQSHEILKMSVAATIAMVAFLIILWRRKYVYLIFIIFPLLYIVYVGLPSKEVCIKGGSEIHLLPVANGTIFETTTQEHNMQKENEIDGWVKVQLNDEKIGWVKDENICSD
jgi:hypothetical protein